MLSTETKGTSALSEGASVMGVSSAIGQGGAIKDAAAKRRGRKIDHHLRGAAAIIEKGVQLHEVERGHQPAVADHLHHQMRLADGGPAGYGGADSGGEGGIEEIHVERDMQRATLSGDMIEKGPERARDALLVDHPHIMIPDLRGLQRLAFGGIDGAQAENADILLGHRMGDGRKPLKARTAGDIAKGCAVQIARGGGLRRMEIAMGVEPEDELRAARGGGVTGCTRDRAK